MELLLVGILMYCILIGLGLISAPVVAYALAKANPRGSEYVEWVAEAVDALKNVRRGTYEANESFLQELAVDICDYAERDDYLRAVMTAAYRSMPRK